MDQEQGIARPSPINEYTEQCYRLREDLKGIGEQVKALRHHTAVDGSVDANRDIGEMMANIMLAYRHIEDARMRLGKSVQAADGGTSCYPK